MADRLTKAPAGYLSWLNLQVEGRNPALVAELLQPVIDISDLYLAARNNTATTTANVTNSGDMARIAVPAGELWRVLAISATLPLVPGTDAADFGVLVGIELVSGGAFIVQGQTYTAGAGPRQIAASATFARPLILGAGGAAPTIAGYICNNCGAARAMTVRCIYQRLDGLID